MVCVRCAHSSFVNTKSCLRKGIVLVLKGHFYIWPQVFERSLTWFHWYSTCAVCPYITVEANHLKPTLHGKLVFYASTHYISIKFCAWVGTVTFIVHTTRIESELHLNYDPWYSPGACKLDSRTNSKEMNCLHIPPNSLSIAKQIYLGRLRYDSQFVGMIIFAAQFNY